MNRNLNCRNYKIDYIKGIGCIAVCLIHVPFPGVCGQLIKKISGVVVPFFFMISGYYAFGIDYYGIKRKGVKILKILFSAFILYLLYSGCLHLFLGDILEWTKSQFAISSILKWIIFCTIDFAIPLWYLIALFETYCFWYFIIKYNKEEYLIRILPFLLILRLGFTSYCETVGLDWFYKTNFITCGLVFYLIGYYVHMKCENISINIEWLIMIIILGYCISLAPFIFNTDIDFSCVGLLIASTSIFLLSVKYKEVKNKRNLLIYIGKNLSLGVYILHPIIADGLFIVINKVFKILLMDFWFAPIIVVVISILVSYFIHDIVKVARCSTSSNRQNFDI